MSQKSGEEQTGKDPLILAMETATSATTVAVGGREPILEAEAASGKYLNGLMARIRDMLAGAELDFKELDAVAVSLGPGNFTGVKIGVATAKTLALALHIPLFGVSTLEVMAIGRRWHGTLCPLIDARRGEIFWAAFQSGPEGWRRLTPDALSAPKSLAADIAYLPGPVKIVGEPAPILVQIGVDADFNPIDDPFPRAKALLRAALARFGGAGDSALGLVPNYIRGAVNRGKACGGATL